MANQLAIHGGTPVRTAAFPSWPIFGQREEECLLAALRSGAWGKVQGREVQQFERRFADYHEARHGLGVVNGTVALRIALMASGIGAGDEVIVPPYTFVATASAVLEANATPVFADLDLTTSNIGPAAIEAVITPRTKAIIPVHLGGLPCDMDGIMALAARHNLTVIEDACHAHGAEYKGRRVGAIGHLGCFSFQSSKNLNCGEGGIIVTNDDELATRCWSIHNCGRVTGGKWYEHHRLGGNYRLGEFQGAVLNAQWERFEEQAETRERNGKYLDEQLSGIPGVYPQVRTADCTRHGYHLFSLRVDPGVLGFSREKFIEALAAEGIPALAGYPIPLYREPVFLNRAFGPYTGCLAARPDLDYSRTQCPQCEILSTQQGVWLEQRLLLAGREDMDDIVRAIRKVCQCRELAAR
ncbi:MAG: DegT/DnrJ/EryC1/StrS family aminotransferase [Planctomycetia bacterium]|nr:DegT/DnrJ/EryC1/StrS family aminotransferase [Planctomycetia bacterium]